MNKLKSMCFFAIVGLVGTTGCVAPMHTGQFLKEMTDLTRLADFPTPAYKTVQFSSYDHRSDLPGGPHWFANSDGFGGEPTPNFETVLKEPDENGIGEYLICDVKGPGVIVRTWTAAIAGNIRLFLDGSRTPLYEGSAAEFLACPYRAFAKTGGIDESLLAGTFQQKQAAYCPIPFAKRCCMVWVGKLREAHFYQVQIRLYESGTRIKTFEPEDLRVCEADLKDAARVLADPDGQCQVASNKRLIQIAMTVGPREKHEVLKLEGPQALERLTLKIFAKDLDKALRQTILHIICDDCPAGQVQAPIGDFFGAAPGLNPFDSLPFTVLPDGTMTCRYVMPFRSSLKMVIDNRGDQSVSVTGSALPMDYNWNDQTSMHFRARWRVDHGVFGSPRGVQDVPFLIANGAGRYVGSALMLLNPCRVSTCSGGWWGEGDEKVFIDDDEVPSTFGTGSEDYFNYAWSLPDIFGYAYCGQPREDGPGNRGFVVNQRWHIIDDLPFNSWLAFYLELYPHGDVPNMSYARIGYHYARPGTIDDHLSITDEDVRMLELPPNWQPAATHGMRNAVFHQAEEFVRPGPRVTTEQNNLWAGSQLLVWHPVEKGEQLELCVPVPEDGKYQLHLGLALNAASGRISTRLDGRDHSFGGGGGIIDLYVPHRVLARQYRAPEIGLTRGEHTLTIVFEGAAADVAKPTIGIDYFAVQKIKEPGAAGVAADGESR